VKSCCLLMSSQTLPLRYQARTCSGKSSASSQRRNESRSATQSGTSTDRDSLTTVTGARPFFAVRDMAAILTRGRGSGQGSPGRQGGEVLLDGGAAGLCLPHGVGQGRDAPGGFVGRDAAGVDVGDEVAAGVAVAGARPVRHVRRQALRRGQAGALADQQ